MIECVNFKAFSKGVTQGFADLKIIKWGGIFYGCSLCMKNGHKWVNFPSRQYKDENAETKYLPHFRFDDKETKDKFDVEAIQAIEKFCKEKNIDLNQDSTVRQQYRESEETPF